MVVVSPEHWFLIRGHWAPSRGKGRWKRAVPVQPTPDKLSEDFPPSSSDNNQGLSQRHSGVHQPSEVSWHQWCYCSCSHHPATTPATATLLHHYPAWKVLAGWHCTTRPAIITPVQTININKLREQKAWQSQGSLRIHRVGRCTPEGRDRRRENRAFWWATLSLQRGRRPSTTSGGTAAVCNRNAVYSPIMTGKLNDPHCLHPSICIINQGIGEITETEYRFYLR